MKKSLTLFPILFLCFGMLGCGVKANLPTPTTPSTSTTSSAPTTTTVSDSFGEDADAKTVTIYSVDLDVFDSFMDSRSSEVLCNEERYCYPQDGNMYITCENTLKTLNDTFASFVTDGLAPYLHEQGIDGDITEYAVYDAPDIPLTIWAKTTQAEAFVTVDEQPFDPDYTYRFYTASDYEARFQRREVTLYVRGQPVPSDHTVLMNETDAVLPLMTVLKACGATVTETADDEFVIDFQKKQYAVDLHECTLFGTTEEDAFDLLILCGGVSIVYADNHELMVDTAVLRCVMRDMGYPVDVTYDTQGNALRITPTSENAADKLIREIDGAYKEAQKLPDSSTTTGMVELANTYKAKWVQVADDYYNKLMQYDGLTPPAEHYATSEDLHTSIAEMKTNWEQYYQTQCETYLKVLKARYQGGTIVSPLIAQYGYELQMEWALELVYICQMFQIA